MKCLVTIFAILVISNASATPCARILRAPLTAQDGGGSGTVFPRTTITAADLITHGHEMAPWTEPHTLQITQCNIDHLRAILSDPRLRPLLASVTELAAVSVSEGAPQIGSEGGHLLAQFEGFTSLRRLTLVAQNLKDEGVARLCAAPWIRQIEHLNLTMNGIRNDGAIALSQAPLDNIQSIQLPSNLIGTAGETPLRAAFPNKHIVVHIGWWRTPY
jgi:hypothetical protein